MKISDLLSMCIRNLTRRKFRTFLTVMGVVIGTCAIVVMISLGVGISVSQEEFLNSVGDLTVIEVNSRGSSSDSVLNDDAVAQIAMLPNIDVATPFMRYTPQDSNMTLFAGKKDRYSFWGATYYLIGISPEALEKLGYTVGEGESLGGYRSGKKIPMLFGDLVVYDFEDTKKKWPNNMVNGWPDENGNIADPFFAPMEESYNLRVSPSKEGAKELVYEMEVIGMLETSEYDYETRWTAFMDINDLKRIKAEYEKENGIKKDKTKEEGYETVKVKVSNIKFVEETQTAIEDMGFSTYSMESIRKELQESAQQTQLILGILGGTALFVAAISITNTMIMSVYERTREIGVMKVLGCLVGDIRTVFLVEAGLIGFIGGVIGVLISCLLSFLLNTFGGALGSFMNMVPSADGAKVSIIPPWLMLLGLAFATLIGLISGFSPANRAVKISALEAIRTE